MSFWKEIKNDFVSEEFWREENCKMVVSIDGYRTTEDDECGEVIARVLLTVSGDIVVVYLDYVAKYDEYAQEKINEAINYIKENTSIEKDFSNSIVKFVDKNIDGCGTDVPVIVKFNKPVSANEVEKLKNYVEEYKKEVEDWDTNSVIQYAIEKINIPCRVVCPAFEITF